LIEKVITQRDSNHKSNHARCGVCTMCTLYNCYLDSVIDLKGFGLLGCSLNLDTGMKWTLYPHCQKNIHRPKPVILTMRQERRQNKYIFTV